MTGDSDSVFETSRRDGIFVVFHTKKRIDTTPGTPYSYG
ncbi:Uncharacterized protein dnm_058100 [Desulfonema magnum]|uniref:Uncharacterized protein n=1 Tax=Desulfonema magnum TaxID=45655 RepID=A0A975BQH4_9BACT|nr:Uncharacterized protein dnm_058100 [Desulfonema magnum]